jgi:hypothetical protein
MAEVFVTFKLPLPLTDTLVRKLRDVVGRSRTTSAASSTCPPASPRCRARTS